MMESGQPDQDFRSGSNLPRCIITEEKSLKNTNLHFCLLFTLVVFPSAFLPSLARCFHNIRLDRPRRQTTIMSVQRQISQPSVISRSYCYTVWSAIGIILSSVCLWRCALWLSGLVYRAKSCTSVFLAGMFLFVPSDTFAVGCIV